MRRLYLLFCLTFVALIVTTPLMAQDTPSAAAAGELCLKYGALIAVGVAVLKRMPFGIGKWIGLHPKVCATVLGTVAALAPMLKGSGLSIAALATCIAATLAGSIGTHEVLLKPAERALFTPPSWA